MYPGALFSNVNELCNYIKGQYHLPTASKMERDMNVYDTLMKKNYTASPSHTIQIDCPEYSYFMQEEWEKGKKRANKTGGQSQVTLRTEVLANDGDV